MDDLKIWDEVDELGEQPDAPRVSAISPAAVPEEPAPPTSPLYNAGIGVIAVLGGIGAAIAGCHPTGFLVTDVLFTFAFGVVVTLAVSNSRRWTWFVLAGMAAAGANQRETLIAALVVVGLSLVAIALPRTRVAIIGAVVGAVSVYVLVRMPDFGFTGSSALWAAVAVAPACMSGYRNTRSHTRLLVRRAALAAGCAVLVAIVGLGIATLLARSKMLSGADQAKSGFDSARGGKQDAAVGSFRAADESFSGASSALNAPWALPARVLPLLGPQAAAAEAMATSGQELAHTAAGAASTVRYEDLRAKGGQVNLQLLASMKQPVHDTAEALDHADQRLADVDSAWLLPQITNPLAEFRQEIDKARSDTALAEQAVAAAPGLLGADGPRRYLILFGNPAETRGLGGFVAAYGELTAVDGKLKLTKSGRIHDLSEAPGFETRAITSSPEFNERYGRFFPAHYLQNLTASPSFEVDADIAREMYPKAGGQPVDGVIYVDPFGLAALLKLTGPVTVEGAPAPLTADNAAMFLIRDQYISVPDFDDRTDVASKASKATFEALTSRELPGPRQLGDALGPAVRDGHLQAVTFDDKGRALLDRLGTIDTFPKPPPAGTGDVFSIRGYNSNPSKIDSYLRREVSYDTTIEPAKGSVSATATVKFFNDAPGSKLPRYIIGGAKEPNGAEVPKGTNTMWVSIYTTLELDAVSYEGRDVPVSAQTELGYHTYSLVVRLPPKSSGTLQLKLHGALAQAVGTDGYQVTFAPQPMVNPDKFTVTMHPGAGQQLVDRQGIGGNADLATEQYTATERRTFSVGLEHP